MEPDAPSTTSVVGDDTPIWHYMDLPKFVLLLARGGLWFAKAAELHDDPYEGFCKTTHGEMPSDDGGHGCIVRKDVHGTRVMSLEQMAAENRRYSANVCAEARDHLCVNSWCLARESMAMWQIYGQGGRGVAVKSSVGQYKLAAGFNNAQIPPWQYIFGEVQYHSDLELSPDIQRDYSQGFALGPNLWRDVLTLGFHKRSCFKYEEEWRAALYQDRPDRGVHIAFDLEQLIGAVYVGQVSPRKTTGALVLAGAAVKRANRPSLPAERFCDGGRLLTGLWKAAGLLPADRWRMSTARLDID